MTAWLGHEDGCDCSYCQRLEKMARKGKRKRPIAESILMVDPLSQERRTIAQGSGETEPVSRGISKCASQPGAIAKALHEIPGINLAERPVSSGTEGRANEANERNKGAIPEDKLSEPTPIMAVASGNQSPPAREIRNDEDKDILQSGSRPQRLVRADSLSDLAGSSPAVPTLFPDFDRALLKPYPAAREGKQVILDDNLEMVGLHG